ncbi:rRNA biogenesis protein rrp5, partial [Cryomyces antarcticus]
ALLAEDGAKEEDVDGPADGDDIDLKKLFHIGQYLRAYATSTVDDTSANGSSKAKRRIELSVNPRQANNGIAKSSLVANSMIQASVVSVEDHGLVMDLGLEDETVKGFLSSKELGHKIDHSRIEEGAVFLCMITGLNQNGNIVKLSADYLKIGNIKKSHFLTEAPTVDVFLPGTAVEILTTEVSSSGVAGKIMGLLDATADFTHSGAGESIKNIESRYKIGSKIKARVICTFPNMDQPRVGISMLGHVLALSHRTSLDGDVEKDPLQKLALSATVGSAKVVKVQPRIGLFLDLGVKGVLGYAHISRLADKKVENLSQTSGPYQLDSTHRARVIGYNPVDGLYIVSLEPKILDQPFLRIEDIEVGQIVKGKVERLILNANGVGGVLVNLAEGISGLVPEMHLADVHLQHPEKKFREGVTVTARVLSTDPEKRQIRLTLKKTLVNSQSTIWKDYSAISVGDQSPGTLINILPAGAVVQFYGTVRGFLPVSEMSEAYIQDPAEHFRLGQVVNVHVLSVNSEKGKMTVTCKDPAAFNLAQQTALKELKPGAFVNASVTEKTNDTINVEIETSGLKAIIHLEQLTDGSEQKNLSAMKRIRVGQKLQDLVLIEKVEKRHLVVLTNKPSLVGAAKAGTLLATFSDVKEGQKAPGFVRNVTPESVYVQFAGGLVGLLLKSQLSADIAKLPAYGLRKGQSISTRVLSVDHAQQRFLLTMRDDAPKTEQKSKPASAALIEDFTIGKLTKARITAIKDTQLNVQLAENLQGRIDVSEVFNKWEEINDRKHPLRKFKPKQIISVRILGIHDARNHRFLPITHRQGRVPVFELSAKTKIQLESEADVLTLDKVSPGSTWIAYVNNIADSCLWVNISPNVRGRVELMDLSDDVSLLGNLEENFPVGSAIRVHVKKVDPSANRLDLSAIKTSSTGPLTLQSISKGMILPGRVTKVTERSVMVQLSDSISGPVTLTELTDDYSRANPTIHKKNEVLRVCIVDVDAPNKKLTLSTRPSKVLSSSLPVKDPQILSLSQLKVNDVVRGFVKNVADQGLFVSLGPSVTAFVRVSDLSDAYIKDWKSSFEVDQLVRGKILNVDVPLNHVQMSLKASIMDENYVPPITFSDLKPGQILTGKVRKVEDFGAFIDVDNSIRVSGLCHRSEIADQRVQDVRKVYEEGDVVKAVVLEVDTEKRRVSFGLKASYFKDAASDGESGDEESDSDVGGAEPEAVASEDDDETEDS